MEIFDPSPFKDHDTNCQNYSNLHDEEGQWNIAKSQGCVATAISCTSFKAVFFVQPGGDCLDQSTLLHFQEVEVENIFQLRVFLKANRQFGLIGSHDLKGNEFFPLDNWASVDIEGFHWMGF